MSYFDRLLVRRDAVFDYFPSSKERLPFFARRRTARKVNNDFSCSRIVG